MKDYFLATATLWTREIVRFYRQPSRLVGALGTPFVFWILIGSGMGTSFRGSGVSGSKTYLQYFFPGALLLILLFTAVFSTISIIEDRKEGFLQGVLISPMPRSAFVLGKTLGGTTIALLQAGLFLVFLPWLGVSLTASRLGLVVILLFLNGFALTGLGLIVAWKLHSIQGFHAIVNLLLMPMWFLSGALFPPEGAPVWIRTVMAMNPLTYGLSSLQLTLYAKSPDLVSGNTLMFSSGVLVFFCAAVFLLGVWSTRGFSQDTLP